MKILHTSDWHLGHTLYNYDRTPEHTAMIQQMVDIVAANQPDLFLISGDIYHTGQPSSAVQTLFSQAMVQLHAANPAMHIVVTAGNHDSGSKLDIFRAPWLSLDVHTLGAIERDDLSQHIISIPGKGFVIAVPYAYERNIPEGFFQQLLDLVAEQNSHNLPVVLSAHTTVRGCDFTGHDHASELTVGGIDTYDLEQLGQGYDYLALGHIHHPQFIHSGHHNVRYSGSPIPVSFDEAYPHSVSLVTIEHHGDCPQVQEIAIRNPHPLVTLPPNGIANWDEARQLLVDFPSDNPAYIRLNVLVPDFLPPTAQQEAQQICELKQCRFCYIKVQRPLAEHTSDTQLTLEQFQEEQPLDIAIRYAHDTGVAFDEDLQRLFIQALDDLNHNN